MLETGLIFTAMKPFLRLARIFGVYPIIRKNITAALLLTYSLVIATFLGYASFGQILWLQNVDVFLYDSLVHLSIEKAQKGFLYINYLTIFASAIYYHKLFHKALLDIDKVDRSLILIGMSMKYEINSIIITGVIKFTSLVSLSILDYFLSSDTYWLFTAVDLISTHGPLVPIYAYQLQFYAILTFIAQHVHFIKLKLKNSIIDVAFENRFPKIYELIRIYDRLRSISMQINEISSTSIVITVASIFFLGIVNIHLVSIAGSYKQTQLFAFLILGLLLRMYELWAIVQPFVSISKEDKLYFHIATKKEIHFTAWEFFVLDYSLIQSVVGAASTLLVILIQYSLSKRQLWCEET